MPNGKIDRVALLALESNGSKSERTYTPPRTRKEKVLADIWSQVLGLPRVGIDDNFFELGGDSIQSMQIVARANQAGLHLTPRQLFQFQTLSRLSAVAIPREALVSEQGMVTGDVPLTPIQQWFFEQNCRDVN